jgi:hypothetical protein
MRLNQPFQPCLLGMEYVRILKFQYSGVVENFKLNVLIIIILKNKIKLDEK